MSRAALCMILIAIIGCRAAAQKERIDTARIISHSLDLKEQELRFYWQNPAQRTYRTFENLGEHLQEEGKELVFAMNGGMFKKDFSPQGLYIENGQILAALDTLTKGYGNFYLQPNGIFFINKQNEAAIHTTKDFSYTKDIAWATQSGPMLLIEGKMHPAFRKGFSNLHIRNGVGILPNGNLLFALSKEKINFYDFASFFKQNGCKNALYLDGFVSRMYLPEKDWIEDGQFGVIIAEIKSMTTAE
ncbi:MAG: phosphodiester glycosidase family protein [Bacteroidota bacterium]